VSRGGRRCTGGKKKGEKKADFSNFNELKKRGAREVEGIRQRQKEGGGSKGQ